MYLRFSLVVSLVILLSMLALRALSMLALRAICSKLKSYTQKRIDFRGR
jgi:hypothetical protein